MLHGFGCVALLFLDLAEHVEVFGIVVYLIESTCRGRNYPLELLQRPQLNKIGDHHL